MRTLPSGCVEIFLNQGESHFGEEETRVRTLLGSCVAVTMWHPQRRLGGMCHFLVPQRTSSCAEILDGRYGNEAILMLVRDAVAAGTDPAEYRFKVFGGGNMFPSLAPPNARDVGNKNVAFALRMLAELGLEIDSCHVGDSGHRNVIFDIWSGDVWLRHQRISQSSAA